MLRAVLIFLGCLIVSPAMAGGIDDIIGTIGSVVIGGHGGEFRPGPGGGMRCSAQDTAWEEHFGGHRDCRECLRRHGRCIETCDFAEYSCVARGYRWGRVIEVEEYGYDERDTEDKALWSCERRGGRDCRLVGRCDRRDRSERRDCAQDGNWGGGHGGGGHGGGHGPHRP